MTRPTEGELVDLQRKARGVFSRVDNLAEYVANHEQKFSRETSGQIELAAHLAQEVSDAVDGLCHLAQEVSDAVDGLCDYIRKFR